MKLRLYGIAPRLLQGASIKASSCFRFGVAIGQALGNVHLAKCEAARGDMTSAEEALTAASIELGTFRKMDPAVLLGEDKRTIAKIRGLEDEIHRGKFPSQEDFDSISIAVANLKTPIGDVCGRG